MKNNSTIELKFEGLLLNEAIDDRIINAGHNLILEVAPTGVADAMIVKSGIYEKRDDGLFSLEIVFPETKRQNAQPAVTDLVVALFEHDDAPHWLLDSIAEGINDNSSICSFNPDYVRVAMQFTTPKSAEVDDE